MSHSDTFKLLLTTLGRETSTVFDPIVGDLVTPQDGYELFRPVCGETFNVSDLRALTQENLDNIAKAACDDFETDKITSELIQEIVKRVIDHW